MAILFRLPDVFESTNCTPGFVEPGLGVLPFWTMLSVHSHSPGKMSWTVDLCRCWLTLLHQIELTHISLDFFLLILSSQSSWHSYLRGCYGLLLLLSDRYTAHQGSYTHTYFRSHWKHCTCCLFVITRDTAGQERFRTLTSAYYRGAMVYKPCVVPENAQTSSGRFFGLHPPAILEISHHYPKEKFQWPSLVC